MLSCVAFEAGRSELTPVLSLDAIDITGEHQHDIEHSITKTRLSKEGKKISASKAGRTSAFVASFQLHTETSPQV